MTRNDWSVVSRVFTWTVAAFIGCLGLIAFLAPKPGAPEGQRSLEVAGIWISRVHQQVSASGHHRWWSEVNWAVVLAVVVLAGVAGYARSRFQTEMTR